MTDDDFNSVRIPCDGRFEYRRDVIRAAQDRFGLGRARSLVYAAETADDLDRALDVLVQHPDASEELVAAVNDELQHVDVSMTRETSVSFG